MKGDSQSPSKFSPSKLDAQIQVFEDGDQGPLLGYISSHASDRSWCTAAIEYLVQEIVRADECSSKSNLMCLSMITQWNRGYNDSSVADVIIEQLNRISRRFNPDPSRETVDRARFEELRICIHLGLTILANVPSENSIRTLQETARDNKENEFGIAARECLSIATMRH